MEMDVLPETSAGDVMSAAQQQLFFKEASDATYRAKSNLTPDQQVFARMTLALAELLTDKRKNKTSCGKTCCLHIVMV